MTALLALLTVGVLIDAGTTAIGLRLDAGYEQDGASIALLGSIGILPTLALTLAFVFLLAWSCTVLKEGKFRIPAFIAVSILTLERWVVVLGAVLWLHERMA